MKKIIALIAISVMAIAISGCESCSRDIKSIKSDWGGGLYRTVTLMDYQGDTLKQWTGKFDVRDVGTDNQVYFDMPSEDGTRKRVWIQGGIVVNEEH